MIKINFMFNNINFKFIFVNSVWILFFLENQVIARSTFASWLLDYGASTAKANEMRYHDCGGQKKTIYLQQLHVVPNTFKLPQNISVTARLKIAHQINSPIQTEMLMKKKVPYLGYVQLPCIQSFGSCTYSDVCDMLKAGSFLQDYVTENSTNACAWVKAFGLPCGCPLPKGLYIVDKTNLPLAGSLLPNWVEAGKYETVLKILQNGITIGCISASFTIL